MERINTQDGLFHDGDPFNNIQGTTVTAAWLNSLQEEIAAVIEDAGITLDPAQDQQLLVALSTLFAPVGTVTQPVGDRSDNTATDAFVATAIGGVAIVNVAGGANVVLSQAQWGCGIVVLVGALTADINVVVPAQGDQWKVANRTTGNFKLTFKTNAGTGVLVPQGANNDLFCDGVNVLSVLNPTLNSDMYFFGQL